MEHHQWLKALSLIAYIVILIPGWMMALPLGVCLASWCTEPNTLIGIFAVGAITGLVAIIVNQKVFNNKIYIDTIGFALLLLPLINRLLVFPTLAKFTGFMIPAIVFVILFVVYFSINYRKI